ncbi:DUF2783 domain-containing protein [Rhodobacteraceae bacterium CCMM004]|nr:DUF2783 domain-containing protein [Rhodobacteraceae bacterium CCMM004]
MADLILEPNLGSPDDFYADLIAAHDGLSDDQSEAFNNRLILVLANHIGDRAILRQALEASK